MPLLDASKLSAMRRVAGGLTQALPTPARLYLESVLGGKRDTITEQDFSPEELAAMRELAAGGHQGAVQYDTYASQGTGPNLAAMLTAKGRVANSLGQFTYQQDPEGLRISDNYDFNPAYKDEGVLMNIAQALGTGGLSGLHLLGEHVLPPGSGRPVSIRIPSRLPNE